MWGAANRSKRINRFDLWIERVAALRQNAWAGAAIGLALLSLGLAVRIWLRHDLAPFPFLTFFPAIILTAMFGGARPAALVTALSALASWYLFMGPEGGWHFRPQEAVGLAFYLLVAAIDIALIEMLQRVVLRLKDQRAQAARLLLTREAMFKELQHRVANNMQFVSSLLAMQQRQVAGDAAAGVLEQASTRLRAMSRVHRMLYDPANADRTLGPMIEELCQGLLAATGAKNIAVRVDPLDVRLPIDRVLTLSMVLTEALTNAIKHAFPDGRAGTVRISLERLPDDEMLLIVADDGQGLPEGFDPDLLQSLGMRIVRTLAEQLGGGVSYGAANPGAQMRLRFRAA